MMATTVTNNITTTTAAMTTTDGEEVKDEEGDDLWGTPVQPAIFVPVVILIAALVISAVGGNLLVIVSYWRDRQLRSVHNFYILNLAVTDLLLGVSSMPFYGYYTLTHWSWPWSRIHCKLWLAVDFTLCLESVLIIIVISIDRLVLVKAGMDYVRKVTWRVAYIQVAVSWALSFLLYGPAILSWDVLVGESIVEEGDCDVEFANDFAFTMTTAVIEFCVPLLILAVLNLLVYLEIRKRMRVSAARSQATKMALSVGQNEAPSGEASNEQQRRREKEVRKDVKAAKALAILVIALGITWGPYTVCTVIIAACSSCVNEYLYESLNWLLWAKASINPLLYAYNGARFRDNFARLLRPCGSVCKCCECCNRCSARTEPSQRAEMTVQTIS